MRCSNVFLTEEYNSPQSVYWALKSLVVVGLTADKPFWNDVETPYPEISPGTCWLPAPRQLICNHPAGNHHFMLNPSQYLIRAFKNATAKYCKFAYSSAFPLSLAVGNVLVSQLAVDNALFLSRDGTESWATKRLCTDARVTTSTVIVGSTPSEELTTVSAEWFSWADRQVAVTTTMIPPCNRWPDWHIRIHKIVARQDLKSLEIVEGGFAIYGQRSGDKRLISGVTEATLAETPALGQAEGLLQEPGRSCIFSSAGASGISVSKHVRATKAPEMATTVSAIRPESNTNLASCRTQLPIAQHSAPRGLAAGEEIMLVTKVFAISTEANGGRQLSGKSPLQRWLDQPQVKIATHPEGAEHGDHILIDHV